VGRADIHIHTRVSDGMATIERVLERVEHETDLDVIAVTDHEDVTGGLRARDLAAKRQYRFEVIPGSEITTIHGHVLALFVERDIPSFRRVESTLEMIHAQGGLAVAPHPLSWLTRSVSARTLDRLAARGEASVTFDAIELANPSPAGMRTRDAARRGNVRRWRLPAVGASDAHHLAHIGTGWTEFAGDSAAELKAALASGEVRAGMGAYPSLRQVGIGQVALGLAWGYSATPRKMLRGRWKSR